LAEFRAFTTNHHPLVKHYYHFYDINLVSEGLAKKQTIGIVPFGREQLVGQAFITHRAQANILLVHGYMDHAGLYGKIIRHLLAKHINVFILDLQGHGLSTGAQASINHFFDYSNALTKLLVLAKHKFSRKPWYLCGQSMGGALAMTLLQQGGHRFEKTILLAPLVRPAQWVWMRDFHSMAKPLLNTMPRSFQNNSHDTSFHRFISRKDTLQTKIIPVQWITAWREWKRWFLSQPPHEASVLLLQGTDDNTIDWEYGLLTIPDYFPRVQVCEINHARHHMVNESGHYLNQIFTAIDQYLGDELSPAQSFTQRQFAWLPFPR